jgi:Lipopolysaccharide kinase (Kdo/WaaP) family
MSRHSHDSFQVDLKYQPLIRQIGLDAAAIFNDPRIKVWRSLPDRENCTLDEKSPDGKTIRLHIKRYTPSKSPTPADIEVAGSDLLQGQNIPTSPPIAHGRLRDGRSFVIFKNLDGYTPADKLIESGISFDKLLLPTADIAAMLHNHKLHHRDLYLCHFMARLDNDSADIKLIDAARVARLGNALTRRRWITKDLAQFWYSTTKLPITDKQRKDWLTRYAKLRGTKAWTLLPSIRAKVRSIARHDVRLNQKQPRRNISLKH